MDTLPKTLASVEDFAHSVKILDTGSTDDTVTFAREWGKSTGIPTDIIEEPFVNFEVSRNRLLDFVDEDMSIVCGACRVCGVPDVRFLCGLTLPQQCARAVHSKLSACDRWMFRS